MTKASEEPEEPSRAAGGCVLVVVVGGVTAVVFAVSPTAGVLSLWTLGVLLLWRSARRRMSDSSATPPPEAVAPSGDVFAVGEPVVTRVERGPEGVTCTIHVAREEVNGE
jgi:hypothetical protein